MKIVKTLALAFAFGLTALQAGAIPAKPGLKKQIRLADGTLVTATLQGDEHQSYYRLSDGRLAVNNGEGTFRLIEESQLASMRKQKLQHLANMQGTRTFEERRTRRQAKAASHRATAMQGNKKGLVLLVNFSDNSFKDANPQPYYQRYFNEQGFNDNGMTGSVADYFRDQSYGKLNIDFDVVGPISMNHSIEYYGGNDANSNDNLAHIHEMVVDACQAVDGQLNFADYDWDGDDVVDQVYIIYAGYGEATGGGENTIWPHEHAIYDCNLVLDGMRIYTYACSNELDTDNTVTGIGTACHEFSHCLGIMDHYDTSGGTAETPVAWDVMASGSYNNNSCTPVGYTAYERWVSGWLTPTELSTPTQITGMKAIDQEPEAYVLYNDANRNEFYLLENRQQNKWNMYPGGHGLLVMHVDYSAEIFYSNLANADPDHPRMTVVAADGAVGSPYEGDTYPGTADKTRLTDDSSPRATVYTADRDGNKGLGKPITGIREAADGTISFMALEGVVSVPENLTFKDVSATGFTVNWDAVPQATGYTVSLREVPAPPTTPAEAVLVQEDFSKCISKSVGMSNIASRLDNYLSTPGFTGDYCYTSPKGLQLGKAQNLGSLVTPVMPEPLSGNITIIFGYTPSGNNAEAKCHLNFTGTSLGTTLTSDSAQLSFIVTQDGQMGEGPFSLTFKAVDKPMAVTDLIVLDGLFSEEELDAYLSTLDGNVRQSVQWLAVQQSTGTRAAKAPSKVKGTLKEFTTTSTSYTFSGLSPKNNYYVSVKATTPNGASRWSAEQAPTLPDGVQGIAAPESGNDWYTLQGMRISRPTKPGIYIKGGRKVVVQ